MYMVISSGFAFAFAFCFWGFIVAIYYWEKSLIWEKYN